MLSRLLSKISSLIEWSSQGPQGIPQKHSAKKGGRSSHPPQIPEWKPGDIILNRYRVEDVMSGSMGNVYISEHLGWGIKVAIKSPRPEVLADKEGMRRILKEANNWVRMGMHPNVASCYFVLGIHNIPHLFIEYIDGGSLSEWIKTGRCKNLRTALSLAIQFCHGMEYTHKQGIIHRDIKPPNILITKNALVKITDFGILLAHGDKDPGTSEIKGINQSDPDATVGFRGTIGYASPEQLRDAHVVDRRSDIFSFGLCLWVMICGNKPFTNNAVEQLIPTPISNIPGVKIKASLKEILIKSVAFSPDDRYADFAEMREALNKAYAEAFNTPCPYAEFSNINLKADSLNNRAVSLFELGANSEAASCLAKTLEINDTLPEAVYNMILLKWRSGKVKPARILRQIEATKKLGIMNPWLNEMEVAVKRSMMGDSLDATKQKFPEFRLCIPRNSLEVFREGQLHLSIQRNILDHLKNRRYSTCHDILMTAWQNNTFKKDPIFNKAYDSLLQFGRKKKIAGLQRYLTLKGFGAQATSLAYIPDTKKFVTACPDGKVILRDLGTSKEATFLGDEGSPITAMAVCPKGKHIAVGRQDGSISLYSPQTGKIVDTEASAHSGPVHALAFSESGRHLASGGADGLMKIRKLSTGPETTISIKDGGAVRSIIFTNNDLDLATGSEDGTLRLWESCGKECTKIIEAHAMPIIGLSRAPDGIRFASTSNDRSIKCWEQNSGRCLRTITAHDETVTSVLFLQDNRTIATGYDDDLVKLWDSETGENLAILDGRGDGIFSLAHGPKPHTFLAGRNDGAIVLWMIIYQLQFD